jgi:single-strand DNA-binding protein
MDMNIVALIGNVTTDPELTVTGAGTSVCTFRIAVSRRGGDAVDRFLVMATERQAEVCAEYLSVGRRIGIEGRLEVGNDNRVIVIASRVQLLGKDIPK